MSTPIIGAKVDGPVSSLTDGRSFGLGDRFTDNAGKEYVWVQADGAITGAGYVAIIDETYQAVMVSTSNDAEGDLLGVAPAAFADNDYGWLQVKGPCVIRVAASCGANVKLNTTSTAGQLDDDGGVTALRAKGMYLTTANGGSAGTAAGVLNYPVMADDGDGYTDGITAGTVTANKAMVVDTNKDIAGVRHLTIEGNLVTGATTLSEAELAFLDSLTSTQAEVVRATDLSARIVVLTATTAITETDHEGRTLVMREAGGNALCTFTLPAATGGGGRYRFVVDEVNTSNYVIKSVAGADVMRGTIIGASTTDSATDAARTWASGATDDTITLNGTTTGGVKRGDWIELEDIAADTWFVTGFITQSGSEATPFSDTVA